LSTGFHHDAAHFQVIVPIDFSNRDNFMTIDEPQNQASKLQSIVSPPVIRIEPSQSWFSLKLRELSEYRELLYFLAWRDVKVRYKQTVIGVGWAVLQPVITMIVFTAIFGRFAQIPSDDLPYPLFSFSALIPWTYFSTALNRSIASVVADGHLISKVYFPRLILPLASTLAGIVDFSISLIVLLGMMVWYGVGISWWLLTLPAFLLFALLTALAAGLWLSALNVRYHDVGHAVPFLIQIWMFCSPIVYPVSLIPERYRLLYSLNPMVGVIEGFRWALLKTASPNFSVMAVSAVVVLIILTGGLIFFKNMARTFADVV
jgi:lipopolysaccharide transport system permease protein